MHLATCDRRSGDEAVEQSVPDRRGGHQSGKQTLHSEVCRELGLKVSNVTTIAETIQRWGAMGDEDTQSYSRRSDAQRREVKSTAVGRRRQLS